jgi:hypothetical protein
MKSKVRILLFIILAGLLCLGGCQTAKKPTPANPTNPAQVTESDKRVMANRFSTIAQGVPGVTKATVVVAAAEASQGVSISQKAGKLVVLAGLTLDAKTMASTAQQQTVKNTVKTKILNSDKRITDVLVTSDANMVKKINDVAAGLIEGKPVISYAKSAAELGKMMKSQTK